MTIKLNRRLQLASDLIDTLTTHDAHDTRGLLTLCNAWSVSPIVIYPRDGGRPYYDIPETIRKLAFFIANKPYVDVNDDE